MDRPLADLVVLDLTRALSGPIATRLLADLGAEVIKIEPPDADLTRSIVPHVDNMATYFVQYNAGKRCVSIDLATEAGRELVLRLAEGADVLVENYRPGVLDRLGLGYDVLAARNPALVVCSISGWGHGTSRSGDGAFASVIHAEAGVTELVARHRDEAPRNDPMPHADVYGGLHALAALLAALHRRDRTGRGDHVEVSMAESTLMASDLVSAELSGAEPEVGFRGGQHWSGVYALADGRPVSVTVDCAGDYGFGLWTAAAGRADLADDERFATSERRHRNRAALQAEFAPWVATFTSAADLQAALGGAALVSEVRTVPELAASAWAAERGAFVEVDVGRGTTVTVPQSPWRFRSGPAGVRPTVGFRGEHNRAVLAERLGLDDAALDRLEADGVLSSRLPAWRTPPT